MKKSTLSGGGYGIAKNVKAGTKVEPSARKVNVAGVSQTGMATAFVKTPLYGGKGYSGQGVGPTGIANARKGHEGAGPGGGGRVIYRSGSQQPTPPVKELPKGDILGSYGPERSKG